MEGTWYYVYILRSLKDNSLYVGFTKNLQRRILFHENGLRKSTKGRRPLELIFVEAYSNESDARRREIFYKTGWGRETLKRKLKSTLSLS